MVYLLLAAVAAGFVPAVLLTRVVRWGAGRVGFVDRPAGHKRHRAPVPLGGGTAVFLGLCLPLVVGMVLAYGMNAGGAPAWLPESLARHLPGIASKLGTLAGILLAALFLHVVGLIDDRRPLGPWSKLLAQVVAGLFIAGPMGIRVLEVLPAPISIAVTVLWIVVITNAMNFLDNMDGLSAGVAAIVAVIFALAALHAGQLFVPVLSLVFAGALLGFLVYNFFPATIFMGDAGSMVLGFMLSVLTVLTTFYDPARSLSPLAVCVPLLVLAVPLYDVASVVIHRVRAGESPFRGDARHFSHRLVRRGMTVRQAVLTIYLATAATGLPAILLPRVSWGAALLLMGQCACVVGMVALLEHTGWKDEKPLGQ